MHLLQIHPLSGSSITIAGTAALPLLYLHCQVAAPSVIHKAHRVLSCHRLHPWSVVIGPTDTTAPSNRSKVLSIQRHGQMWSTPGVQWQFGSLANNVVENFSSAHGNACSLSHDLVV
jgi:hypothetical protein